MLYLVLFLFTIMIVTAIAIMFIKDISGAIIVTSIISLVASVLFLIMAAPDVAITEASIGSALTLVVFMLAVFKTQRGKK